MGFVEDDTIEQKEEKTRVSKYINIIGNSLLPFQQQRILLNGMKLHAIGGDRCAGDFPDIIFVLIVCC